MSLRLDGKSIVITGSGRGIGKAFAEAVAAVGGQVLINDIDPATAEATCAEINGAGGKAAWLAGSVVEPETGEALMRRCREAFGRIDGLINNAGRIVHAYTVDTDPAAARAVIETNLLGAYHCGAAALRAMAETGGVIVNVVSGALEGRPNIGVYGATKGGLNTLTTVWAKEAPASVRVVGLSPMADTAMTPFAPRGHDPSAMGPLAVYLLSSAAEGFHGRTVRLTQGVLEVLQPATFEAVTPEARNWTAEAIAQALAPYAAGR